MAERKRSVEGGRDTEAYLEGGSTPSQQGWAGGQLQRRIAVKDEERQAKEDAPGITRARKSDKIATGADTDD